MENKGFPSESVIKILNDAESDICFDEGDVYLLTFNPDLKKFQKHETDCSINTFVIEKLLAKMRDCWANWAITLEFSDTGKLHYHGWFQFSDFIKWTKVGKYRLSKYGFIKINKLGCKKAMEKAFKYYKKDIPVTLEIMSDWKVPSIVTHNTIEAYVSQLKSCRIQEILAGKIIDDYKCTIATKYDRNRDSLHKKRESYWWGLDQE